MVLFCTKVVYFQHLSVVYFEEVDEVTFWISVQSFGTLGWEAASNDSVSNVSQIEGPLPDLNSLLLA